MFTLKFQSNKDGTNTTVCGTRFDTQYFYDPEGAGHPTQCHITVYQKLTSDESGIVFQVGGEHPLGYMVAYVENQLGKTIDRFGPFDREKLKAAA